MKVIVNNIATEFDKIGSGPIILMLHGWQDSLHTFDSITENLKQKFTILRIDLPGFGETETPSNSWNTADYVKFVNDFLTKINVSPDYMLGHSFGGRIVIKGVSSKIFKLKRIVLMSSAGISKRKTWRNLLILFVTKIFNIITFIPPIIFYRKKIRKNLYKIIRSDYLDSGILKNTYLKIISEDLKNNAKNIKIPTQLIWGRKDIETPLKDAKSFNALVKNSNLDIINNSGHFVHKEEPLKVSNIIENFLK